MAKAKHSVATRKRKKKVLKQAKGFWGDRSKQYQQAKRVLMHALKYAYRDRRNKKREFRSLWITRINAACRAGGMSYSRFIDALNKAKIRLNRKSLAEIAARDEKTFQEIVKLVKVVKKS